MENKSHLFNVYSLYFYHETNFSKNFILNSRDQGNSRHCVLTCVLYLSMYRDIINFYYYFLKFQSSGIQYWVC